jgi:hypothetical protein
MATVEDEIIASQKAGDRIFYCKLRGARAFFGTQLIGKPETVQFLLPEHVKLYDKWWLWSKKKPGKYTFGDLEITVTPQRHHILTRRENIHIGTFDEKLLMKMLFFATSTAEMLCNSP